MKSGIVLFFFAFLVWMGLTCPTSWQDAVVGAFVSFFVALVTGGMFVKRPQLLKNPKRYFWFFYYIPVFIWECFKANLDVAYRVIHPDLPINPGIVKVKTKLKSETGLTFLANSITLTPGTLSVDIDRENGFIYIHWINVKDKDIETDTKLIVSRFERILEKIFE